MWKLAVFPLLASVILQQAAAQGGAESLAFPGFLPSEYVKARKPVGDDRPNDVYEHLSVRRPKLASDEVVIYPHHFGFEYGQDPEHSIYEVHNAKELVAEHSKKHSKHDKHGKQGKQIHQHDHDHHHHHHEEENNLVEVAQPPRGPPQSGYGAPPSPQQQQFRPRPAFPPQIKNHFG
ncbi:hypothetical protein HAZT_HAZT011443 [Hyalella azteca]|uniref:Uncharacterized histidine-rich protein DDB_G0274557 n=1 Tax=Hyalella azteca TaxID=294128 RepID=A0A6A0GTV4_HYAAZ|nr:uncharacterized histidine-rich protein DDB_G0274557 [Hyalella azteca]KAA0186226.1 hypothetical protein HAZT_HAZT011443 [Hyalella azteca]